MDAIRPSQTLENLATTWNKKLKEGMAFRIMTQFQKWRNLFFLLINNNNKIINNN